MATAPVFPPLIVRSQYKADGSAKSEFLADVGRMTGGAKSQFKATADEIDRMLGNVGSKLGSIKFGKVSLDLSDLRKAAADADVALQRLTTLRDAAVNLAARTGDTSEATRRYTQALTGQVNEAQLAKQAADAQVTSYARLQAELDRTVAGNQRLAESYRAAAIARSDDSYFRPAGAARPDLRSGAEAILAGKAAIDRAAVSATTLDQVLGRVATKGPAIAAAMQQAERAAISGSVANARLADSQRSVRLASIGAGQQLQDLGISLYSGQRASVVFAQQLPQLAFALSSLEGSTNKTLSRVGAFATTLSGPWGLALVGAGALLGVFIDKLIRTGSEAEKSKRVHRDFADVLRDQKSSWQEVTEAAKEYAAAQEKGRQVTLLTIQSEAAATAARLKAAISIREKLAADLEAYEAITRRGAQSESQDVVRTGAFARADATRAKIVDNAAKLRALDKAAGEVVIKAADAIAGIRSDPLERIKLGFDVLRDSARKSISDVEKLTARLEDLNRQQRAAEEAFRQSERVGRQTNGARETAAFGSPLAGDYRISSGYGARARPTAGASTNHLGIDYAAPLGTAVLAAADGIVKFAATVAGYGNQIELTHGAGTASRYAHLSRFAVQEGQAVTKGQTIGYVGQTGTATGAHLHYEVLVNGKKVDPSRGQFPVDPTAVAEAASRAGKVLEDFGESAAERIAKITAQFDRQPKAIDQAAAATRELDRLYKELGDRQLLDPAAVDAFKQARAAIADFSTRPFQEMVKASREQLEVQGLMLAGRGLEAEMLERALALQNAQGVVTTDQLATIRALVLAQREITAEQERQNTLRQIEARLVDGTRDNLRQSLSEIARGGGIGAVGNLFKRQFALVRENALDNLFQSVFGDFFTTAKDRALGFDKVREASRDQVDVINAVSQALRELDRAASSATTALSSTSPFAIGAGQADTLEALFDKAFAGRTGAGANAGSVVGALATANDNAVSPITVLADPKRTFVRDITTGIADVFLSKATAGKIGQGIAEGISGQGHGAAYGLLAGGLVVGKGGSQLGAGIGGALGEYAGKELLGKALGSFAGPLGAIAGGILGSVLGGAIKGTKTGSATLGTGGSISLSGTSGSRKQAASGLGDNVISSLERIAEQLGGTATGAYAVSIGIRDKNYRVDTTGSGITKTKKGALDFGEDSAAAIEEALRDAIQDGAIQGLRAGTQAILKAAKDLQKGVQDAVDFESIFSRLKAHTDPVGAALDDLNKEFGHLRNVAITAGEGMVELEQLYGKERAKVIADANRQVIGSLTSFRDSLTIGDSSISLRERFANAQSAYNPLAARVQAGDRSAYDEFTGASQSLLEISRQLHGSQSEYFTLRDSILGLTNSTIGRETSLADAATSGDSPFTKSAVPSNDNTAVVSAIDQQTTALLNGLGSHLDATNRNLGSVLDQLRANGTTGATSFNFPTMF